MKTLLALTLSGSLLILLLLLMKKILGRKLTSTAYYYAWLIVLLRFLLPLPGMLPLQTQREAPAVQVIRAPFTVPELSAGEIQAADTGNRMTADVRIESRDTETLPVQRTEKTKAVRINWKAPELWLSVWGSGTVTSFILYAASYFRFVGKIRRKLEEPTEDDLLVYSRFSGCKPKLYRCGSVKTPMMIGVLHPMIILPALNYSEDKLENILRHELMHYRRKDTLYKWFAIPVYSAQWFNPLSYLMRREIYRACELSCDEMLLRSMTREEKQSYGDTLLSMAASASLPAGVVATTFATEKKTLKERLDQIMHSRMTKSRLIASLLAFVLLAGCALITGPKSLADNGAEEIRTMEASTVDEFLAAIADNTTIILKEGTYDLSAASTYGADSGSYCWKWEEQYDGPQLVIDSVENLTIKGAGAGTTVISADPRYANVLTFRGCRNIVLEGFTAGHTQEPGTCAGGVIYMEYTQDVRIDGCSLYGCGTIGIEGWQCSNIAVNGTEIYDCSQGASYLNGCRNVSFDNCEIRNHASAYEPSVMYLFYLYSTDNVRITNSDIHDNFAQSLLISGYSRDVVFAGNTVRNNAFLSSVFQPERYSPVVDGCSFEDNSIITWFPGNGMFAVDAEGNTIGKEELQAMNHRSIGADENLIPEKKSSPESSVAPSEDGMYHVGTVDELLAALGSERTIVLDAEYYDLSTASDYGSPGNEYYFWKESYDGPELVITNVHDLTIDAAKTEGGNTALYHTISATPRYANVLSFQYCDNITLTNFTAGHTQEPGSCSGGVFCFQNCTGVGVISCRMYGCGILGIETTNCASVFIVDSEIYECSQGAANMSWTDGITFINCDIHDVPSPALAFYQSYDITWNGQPLTSSEDYSVYDVDENGDIAGYEWPEYADYGEYKEPEIDYGMALLVARSELRRLQDLGILNPEIAFDGELEYAAYADGYTTEEREVSPGFYARDYSGKYMINFRIDSATGEVRSATFEADHDEDDEPIKEREIEINGEIWQYYNNFDDIFPADLTVGRLCDLLAQYWGYSGWTLADTYDEFYGMRMNAPAEDLLISELPEDNYYATVYFKGDQEGAPMYFQIEHFPGRVMFLFGEGHLVG